MNETHLTIGQAAKRLGVSDFTMRTRVREGALPVFVSDVDRRLKLIPLDALDRLASLRPVAPRPARKEATA